MWLVTNFRPTTLFSLKASSATSSAAKTLLCPSPYSVKLAIVDSAIRNMGLRAASEHFDWIKKLHVRIKPPARAVVNNCFVKIRKPSRDENEKGLFGPTVSFREYVFFEGELSLALGTGELDGSQRSFLMKALAGISSFGKRGCFFQMTGPPEDVAELDDWYSVDASELLDGFDGRFMLQILDDMGPEASFDGINTYSGVKAEVGRDRIQHSVLLPYRQVRTSKGYTMYERLDLVPR